MSTENWKLENDLCRCCHSKGSFHYLGEPCKIDGLAEVFSDMLESCFDIYLSPVTGVLSTMTYTICQACIVKLREAMDFKMQVVACEERFQDMYSRNLIEVVDPMVVDIKQEPHHKKDTNMVDPMVIDIKDEPPQNNDTDKPQAAARSMLRSLLEENEAVEDNSIKQKPKTVKNKTPVAPPRKIDVFEWKKTGQIVTPKFFLREKDYKKEGEKYKCARCEKIFNKKETLRGHVKKTHYGINVSKFSCTLCAEKFSTPGPLTQHKLDIHNIDERHKCKACKAAFTTKYKLKSHFDNFHMLGNKYKCKFCDYESFSCANLYKHKFKHKTAKDYRCRFCRKGFLRKSTKDLHEKIHTGDRRKVCEVCGQAFVQKASLNYHMTKYHPEVPF